MIKGTGYCFTLKHVFERFPIQKLKTYYLTIFKAIRSLDKHALCNQVFATHVKIVFNDIIKNDVTFKLPVNARPADIHMIAISDEDFTRCRLHGKFTDVDFLASNFTGYLLGLYMYGKGRTRVKPIYVLNDLKSEITKRTNEGHVYA